MVGFKRAVKRWEARTGKSIEALGFPKDVIDIWRNTRERPDPLATKILSDAGVFNPELPERSRVVNGIKFKMFCDEEFICLRDILTLTHHSKKYNSLVGKLAHSAILEKGVDFVRVSGSAGSSNYVTSQAYITKEVAKMVCCLLNAKKVWEALCE